MKLLREILGYVLGGVLFVGLMPAVMWLATGMPALELAGCSCMGSFLLHHVRAGSERGEAPSPRLWQRV